jgi:hypothetical protein
LIYHPAKLTLSPKLSSLTLFYKLFFSEQSLTIVKRILLGIAWSNFPINSRRISGHLYGTPLPKKSKFIWLPSFLAALADLKKSWEIPFS